MLNLHNTSFVLTRLEVWHFDSTNLLIEYQLQLQFELAHSAFMFLFIIIVITITLWSICNIHKCIVFLVGSIEFVSRITSSPFIMRSRTLKENYERNKGKRNNHIANLSFSSYFIDVRCAYNIFVERI